MRALPLANKIADDFTDLEIRVFPRQDNAYPVEITLREQQQFQRGYMTLDIASWVSSGDLVKDGQVLFESLFADCVLRDAWTEARGQSAKRRIRLRLDANALELHALPWELLHEGDTMLSANASTPFSRYLAVSKPWGGAIEARPIRVLAVISNPGDLEDMYNLAPLDVDVEKGILEKVFLALDEDEIQLDILEPPVTVSRIEEALCDGYHILHYVGHGTFNSRRQQAALYLQDEVGDTEIVRDEAFINMLKRQQTPPRLVFLNACQSARTSGEHSPSTAGAFLGLGPKVVAAGVPAVVAMQDVVTIKTARQLSLIFYRRLTEHGWVDCALNEARSHLLTTERGDAAVPVLFMRLKSGKIWEPEPAAQVTPSKALQVPPPPEPIRPPDAVGFVGRESQLSYFEEKLATGHLAVIQGMPGNGKTTFASVLIGRAVAGIRVEPQVEAPSGWGRLRQPFDKLRGEEGVPIPVEFNCPAKKVFWHSFHENEGCNVLIWKLAGFLYWNGQEALWTMLQSTQQSGGQLPPATVLFDYAFKMLCGHGYLLCFNDFHFVEEDPLLDQFCKRLSAALMQENIALIITSLNVPSFVQLDEFEELGGLSLEDTLELFAQHGLEVSQAQAAEAPLLTTRSLASMDVKISPGFVANLHARTEGNLHFLTMAADALAHTTRPSRVLLNLAIIDNIDQFLVKEIDETLTDAEREVMYALSVFLGYPATRDAVEAVLDGVNAREALRDLRQRHLVRVSTGEVGREYSLNTVVRHFYYDLLNKNDQLAMHQRAGIYYEVEEQNPLMAARHFARLKMYDKAARLLTSDVWALINKGRAHFLEHELAYFTAEQVEPAQWVRVNLARGQTLMSLGSSAEAEMCYWKASASLATLPDSLEMQDLRVEIWYWWAELLRERSAFLLALARIQDGFVALAGRETAVAAHLAISAAATYIALGSAEHAKDYIERALDVGLKLRQSSVLSRAHSTQGWIEFKWGSMVKAIEYYEQALTLLEQSGDLARRVAIHSYVADIYVNLGQWAKAEAHLQRAYQIGDRLGSAYRRAALENTRCLIAVYRGRADAALADLQAGLARLERADGSLGLKNHFRATLARAFHQLGDIQSARQHLQTAIDYFEQIQFNIELPALYRLQARILLSAEKPVEAEAAAQCALILARELNLQFDIGRTLCVLGDIAVESQQLAQAGAYLEQALSILHNIGGEFAWAQAQYSLARLRMAEGQYAAVAQALDVCIPIFERLDAVIDLVAARALREELT